MNEATDSAGKPPEPQQWRAREERRLLQAGMLLFVLALLVGLIVHKFTVPRLALSAHLLGIMQGLFLMVMGLLWPRLALARAWSRIALVLILYGCFIALSANLLGAIWGAGNTMLPFAAGQARGSVLQERILTVGLRTAAASLIAGSLLVLCGLRLSAPPLTHVVGRNRAPHE